ncbi:carbonic anhydrase 2-like [Stomoxys calcitrans]|uniref:carbonic anhydrase 2-like n=1 Tax=Stomoxys calcitrans TaxID=35570 RepID=UPI0027E31D2F|nr:carbonic anhydrase 2-like [Stomoxys calcitrans]
MSFPVFGSIYHRLLFILPLAAESFNYDEPEKWHLDFSKCGGNKQSPIIISTPKSVDVLINPMEFVYYDIPLSESVHLRNNGHTVEFSIPPTILGEKPYIRGGLLDDTYEVEQVHFHWGSPTRKGSEHIVNGNRYDVEMHIVHRNIKYPNVDVAQQFEDGFVVLAVLFKVVKSENVFYPGLNAIYDNLEYVQEFNSSATAMDLMSLGSLLGNINREDFYTYHGSLTTPPCSESVSWIIFADILPISYKELPKFWNILDERDDTIVNIRPIQYKGFRKVFHRKPLLTFKYLGWLK